MSLSLFLCKASVQYKSFQDNQSIQFGNQMKKCKPWENWYDMNSVTIFNVCQARISLSWFCKPVQNRRRGGGGGGGGGYSQQTTRRVGGLSGPGVLSGQGSAQFNSYMGGLVGGEFENPDRVLTGQVNYSCIFTCWQISIGVIINRWQAFWVVAVVLEVGQVSTTASPRPVRRGWVSTTSQSNFPILKVNQNTALLATAAAIAVGAGVLFRAITLQQAGRRRRRRRSEDKESVEDGVVDMLMQGIKKYRS